MDKQLLHDIIALQMIPKIGPVAAKTLIAYCGSPGDIFKQKKDSLVRIPGIGPKISENIRSFKDFDKAAKEVEFIEKHKIKPLYFLADDYPHRLKELPESPIMLFYKGTADLNQSRVLAIVGTRKATEYGKAITEKLVEELAQYKVLVVSGLAYGIDYHAHKDALKHSMETVGVVGHGLDRIYPAAHKGLAEKMLQSGGLLTEFPSGTNPDRENFPARNRIVAGISDGVVLVESAISGGALITASVADSYNREVFAVPGRASDPYSEGCNHFIKTNKAYLTETAADIAYWMGWNQDKPAGKKHSHYEDLTPLEMSLVELLRQKDKLEIDAISAGLGLFSSEVSVILLELEFKGVVQALPGKIYRLL
jgi:DNA processing protein